MTNPFQVSLVEGYQHPQQVTYVALHTDYAEEFSPDTDLSEERCGEIAVKRLLDGKRGHFGPLEHSTLTLALRADHNTMMQLRTHRVGLSFDYQSMRYTGLRVERVAHGELPPEDVFYARPIGTYTDRDGGSYAVTKENNQLIRQLQLNAAQDYLELRQKGFSEEHARYVLPTSYFQNGVITGNLRSWFHLLDVRLKADAQIEIRWAMDLVASLIAQWAPEIYQWYQTNRQGKALLAP